MRDPLPAERPDTPYFRELAMNWRALAAACAGMGAGYLLNHYVSNIFAPHLIAEFAWSRADFALVGSFGLLSLVAVPIVGRLTDLFGLRPVATVGVACFPLTFVAFSAMDGRLSTFILITIAQTLLCGATTTSLVYSRLAAVNFSRARGLALAIAASTPAIVGMIASPLLHALIQSSGWRHGYLAIAAYAAVVGVLALILMPRAQSPEVSAGRTPTRRRDKGDYGLVLRSRDFWIIFAGMLLCNLVYPLQSSQMNLMLQDGGASAATAAWILSLFAAGVMLGRFICGVALDRLPTDRVAAVSLGMPAIGLFLLAAGHDATPVQAIAVVLMGLSLGAESDLAAYLVIRYFRMDMYGTVLGLVVAAIALSATLGSILLSATLRVADGFHLYMFVAGTSSLAGGALFLLLGWNERGAAGTDSPADDVARARAMPIAE